MYSLSVLIRGSPESILCSSIGLGTVVVVVVCTACRTDLITQDNHCLSDRFYHTGQPVCLTDFITQVIVMCYKICQTDSGCPV
jgi:hypothetical protein